MASDKEVFTRIDDDDEIAALVQALAEPGAASLSLENASGGVRGRALPVTVRVEEPGRTLSLAVSAPADEERALRRGAGFRLLARVRRGELRTPVLSAGRFSYRDGRLLCRCAYPAEMELRQRRDTFRAALASGMAVTARLYRTGSIGSRRSAHVSGALCDLSLEGCQLTLPMKAAVDGDLYEVELCFPDGTVFAVRGRPRHRRPDPLHGRLQVGFAFVGLDRTQLRRLGFYVREIEREAARTADGERANLQPSPLFRSR